jgi:MtN3 and saliva related transmembrane protein
MIETIGFCAAILTTSASLPQFIKIVKTKSAGDVSTIMFVLGVVGNFLWFFYGWNTGSMPIFISSIFAFFLNLVNLIFRIKYKDKALSTSKVS